MNKKSTLIPLIWVVIVIVGCVIIKNSHDPNIASKAKIWGKKIEVILIDNKNLTKDMVDIKLTVNPEGGERRLFMYAWYQDGDYYTVPEFDYKENSLIVRKPKNKVKNIGDNAKLIIRIENLKNRVIILNGDTLQLK